MVACGLAGLAPASLIIRCATHCMCIPWPCPTTTVSTPFSGASLGYWDLGVFQHHAPLSVRHVNGRQHWMSRDASRSILRIPQGEKLCKSGKRGAKWGFWFRNAGHFSTGMGHVPKMLPLGDRGHCIRFTKTHPIWSGMVIKP